MPRYPPAEGVAPPATQNPRFSLGFLTWRAPGIPSSETNFKGKLCSLGLRLGRIIISNTRFFVSVDTTAQTSVRARPAAPPGRACSECAWRGPRGDRGVEWGAGGAQHEHL